jgi:hypothetical protein
MNITYLAAIPHGSFTVGGAERIVVAPEGDIGWWLIYH